ncbi:MAG: ribbon-helix-helix domain-containing protein [Candidatus Woesearchaeota archaeon]|jgi:metal-responsive CopG/Arc/MetJ family transcriptional regulator|nr:ribbon-helix-helix domain-containing protein [Candidatus Woesearchaeota archaeon]
MGTQISIKLSDKMLNSAKGYVDMHGYDSIQDFIRETLREKLFEEDELSGMETALASENSLAKNWLSKEEDEAWAHLQKVK